MFLWLFEAREAPYRISFPSPVLFYLPFSHESFSVSNLFQFYNMYLPV